jgi:molybdopterin molybdotransferase
MISLSEAQTRILALAHASKPVSVPLAQAMSRILLSDVIALRDQPAADLSAMDGYAICAAENQAGPWRVIGESAAGTPFTGAFTSDAAVRIFTGAVLPEGADSVIMQENVLINNNGLSINPQNVPEVEDHIRPRAGDFGRGSLILHAGTRLSAASLGLLAASGHGHVTVAKEVHIALITTGNELVAPGEPTGIGQIPSSNDVMLSALLSQPGVRVTASGIIRDDVNAIAKALRDAAETADIIITIGGASVGDHDLVRPALEACGAEIAFWKVAVKPGKPMMAGTLDGKTVIGVPGNPVSAYVTTLLFVRPLINKMLGMSDPILPTQSAQLAVALPQNGSRTDHIRAQHDENGVIPVGLNDSAAIRALASANCLIVRQPHAPPAKAGDLVEIILLT